MRIRRHQTFALAPVRERRFRMHKEVPGIRPGPRDDLPSSRALHYNAPYNGDPRDKTPITIIRHWNRLGIDPHVTFDDLKKAALSSKSSSLISG